jgi:hypothetical protein
VIGKKKPWRQVPADPIVRLLPNLKWQATNGALASANTAALILYATLIFVSEPERRSNDETATIWCRATASYSELETLTGLSRALIAAGLRRLTELKLIAAIGSNQRRVYLIFGNGKGWFKLPCLALFDGEKIAPFHRLSLRSKFDLHAMKLYLYLASVRNNQLMFSIASHKTIHAAPGEPPCGRLAPPIPSGWDPNREDRHESRHYRVGRGRADVGRRIPQARS